MIIVIALIVNLIIFLADFLVIYIAAGIVKFFAIVELCDHPYVHTHTHCNTERSR